jgi:hypothetical protein
MSHQLGTRGRPATALWHDTPAARRAALAYPDRDHPAAVLEAVKML